MAKAKISKKRKKSDSVSLTEHIPFSSELFKDPDLVIETLLDCIREGDLDSFRGVLISHLLTVNKSKNAKKAGIGRRTLYDLLDLSKKFNPELSTVSAVLKAIAA